jgi:AbiV family abortive infection protein
VFTKSRRADLPDVIPDSKLALTNALGLLGQAETLLASEPVASSLHLAITAEEEMAKAYVFFVKEQGFDVKWNDPRMKRAQGYLYFHPAKHHLISRLYVNLQVAHAEIDDAMGYESTVDQKKIESLAREIGLRLEQGEKLRQAIYFDPANRQRITPAFVESYVSYSRKNLDEIASFIEKPMDGATRRNLTLMLRMYDVSKEARQIFPELQEQGPGLIFPDNSWLFTFWFFVFELLTRVAFPPDFENSFNSIYGNDPLNLKKFYLCKMLAAVRRKMGATAFKEIDSREDLKTALRVISILGFALNPLIAQSLPAPPERIDSEDFEIASTLRKTQMSSAIKTEDDLLNAARTLGLEDTVESYSKLKQLVKDTLASESAEYGPKA